MRSDDWATSLTDETPVRSDHMGVDRYLARIGLTTAEIRTPDLAALERLQQAHVRSVPFETLAITGDPFSDSEGAGVVLELSHLYRKLVDRRRGGFCFELNGLFGWLLDELGYDATRVAARVVTDGDSGLSANHLAHLVSLGRRYVVDVGMGVPAMRRPLPLDGTVVSDEAGVEWRVVAHVQPDADFAVEQRAPGRDEWTVRYLFGTDPRELGDFQEPCNYLQTAPDSPFTGNPVVSMATERGYSKLSLTTLTRVDGATTTEQQVDEAEWYDSLEREFGICFPLD